jgi:hypothetical protein
VTLSDEAEVEISGGARICYIMHEIFQETIERVDPNANLDVNEIR